MSGGHGALVKDHGVLLAGERTQQLLIHPRVVGGNFGQVGPGLREFISLLLDIGEELVGAMESSRGLCLGHLRGPSEFLLRLAPLVAQRGDAEDDLVKLPLAPFTPAG